MGAERWRGVAAMVVSLGLGLPLLVFAIGSLHPPGELLPRDLELLTPPPSFAAFPRAFELAGLARQLGNSILVAAVVVPVSVVVTSWAGFAMVLLPKGQRRLALAVAASLLIIPAAALWLPRFLLLSRLGLVDTPAALMVGALVGTTPVAVLLFFLAYRRVPRDLLDLARLEGLSALRTWREVAAPLVRPATAAVAGLVFIATWGNFIDALLYLNAPEEYTLPRGLAALRLLGPTDASVVLAGSLVATLPAAVAFALVQRRLFGTAEELGR